MKDNCGVFCYSDAGELGNLSNTRKYIYQKMGLPSLRFTVSPYGKLYSNHFTHLETLEAPQYTVTSLPFCGGCCEPHGGEHAADFTGRSPGELTFPPALSGSALLSRCSLSSLKKTCCPLTVSSRGSADTASREELSHAERQTRRGGWAL